jgi:hypothetical protein
MHSAESRSERRTLIEVGIMVGCRVEDGAAPRGAHLSTNLSGRGEGGNAGLVAIV